MKIKNQKFSKLLMAIILLASNMVNYPIFAKDKPFTGRVKNVIVMIPDGCSNSIQTLARWKKGKPLALDGLNCGAVKTFMANSIITESSAAATAFATGYKTSGGFLSIGPRIKDRLSIPGFPTEDNQYKPLATVLEGAKLIGKATGLVVTSRITHATPAAYASHIHNRYMENEIMEQMVYENVDVVMGGGKRLLLPANQGGLRNDGENLITVLLNRGYCFVETTAEMKKVNKGKLWGIFSDSHLVPHLDRDEFAPHEPSLAEMTLKAIELLSEDRDGFFLMVEGSQIDWAGHANDPVYMVTDFLAFDNAVKVALDFAKKEKNTLLLIFPDHNTGGLSIGSKNAKIPYSTTSVQDLINPLDQMKITSTGLVKKIGSNFSPENIMSIIKKWWNIDAKEDIEEIMQLFKNGLSLGYAISRVISKNHTILGWTTHGHSGEDVPLWSFGPQRPCGLYNNTELAKMIADVLGFDLKYIEKLLFVEVGSVFKEYNIDKSDPKNPVLKIGKAQLPINKDLIYMNGKMTNLNGIVFYSPHTQKSYIPLKAIKIIKKIESPAKKQKDYNTVLMVLASCFIPSSICSRDGKE